MRFLQCIAVFIALCWSGDAAADAKRPNVLLIVADDMRPDAVSALGNSAVRTPTLDRLVRSGVSFPRAICAYPICVSSRAEMLTGCTAFRAQQPYAKGTLNAKLPRWPDIMHAAGYHTWYVGKWHTTGKPTNRGYEATRGLYGSGGGKNALTFPVDHRGHPVTGYTGWVFQDDDGKTYPERGVGLTPNISERFADAAIELIKQANSRPFFLHVNFAAPHDPRFLPRGYEHAYDPTTMPLPKNFATEHPFEHGNLHGRDEVLLPRPLTPELIRKELTVYYALIEHMDAQIGRILATLEKMGLRDDTIVVFTSDHGLALGSHGLTGKQNMYEHTIGVPLIVAGPGIAVDRRSPAQCYLRDLFPTACELVGIEVPKGLDGKSFASVLKSPQLSGPHEFVVGYFLDTQRMIRGERWKLIRYPQIGREQLFDLLNDPDELQNRIDDMSTKPIADDLRNKLTQWLSEHDDPLTTKK